MAKKKQRKGEVKGIEVPRRKYKTFEKIQKRQDKRQKKDANQLAADIVSQATR
jgi:hypothetical protein